MSDSDFEAERDWDTLLSVPGPDWSAALMLQLKLEGTPLDLPQLTAELLSPAVYEAVETAIAIARPNEWTARQISQALNFMRQGDFVLAWPLLVIGVEGLHWEEAERGGFIDPETGRVTAGDSAGKTARDAHDLFRALPINERVRKTLSRYAFGAEANAFRHGRIGSWGEQQQCAIWMLALIAWLDGSGWRHFSADDPDRLRAGSRSLHEDGT